LAKEPLSSGGNERLIENHPDPLFARQAARQPGPVFAYRPPDSDRWVKELQLAKADVLRVGHTPSVRPAVWSAGSR
jgi:hypothetical protein